LGSVHMSEPRELEECACRPSIDVRVLRPLPRR